jgi:hypothetical protein
MPDSLPRMRTWLRAVGADLRAGPDFAEWTAKHALHITGTENEILWFLHDLADWVRASHGNDGQQFVVRPFNPTMSLRTVTKLSAEWHETVASNLTGPQHAFRRHGSRQPESTAWKLSRSTIAQTSIAKALPCITASAITPRR